MGGHIPTEYLKTEWPRIRQEILDGSYRPKPVRRVQIPKPGGGQRELGIPTVIDRMVQQALLQVLQPLIDPTFSEHSHGFRPGRSAHGAILEAQGHIEQGCTVVVDVDLEKFFDRVNHDILMGRLARRIADKAVLRLTRRYLYSAHMNLAHEAWKSGNIQRVVELLDQHRPVADQDDLRSFEWGYLWRQCHREKRQFVPDRRARMGARAERRVRCGG